MGLEYDQFIKAAAAKKKEILRLSRKGVSQTKIAERMGLSRQRVHQVIKSDQREKELRK